MTRNCIWIGVFSQVVTLPWSDRAARARIRHRTVRVASRCRTDRPGRMGYCHRRLTRRARVHARTRATLDTSGPTFAAFDNAVYRFGAARVPGATAAAVVGMLVDDRFAAQLKSQVDADVTLLQGGRVLASSLPQGDERARLTAWAAAPGPGYGILQIRLPYVGTALSGKLPQGAKEIPAEFKDQAWSRLGVNVEQDFDPAVARTNMNCATRSHLRPRSLPTKFVTKGTEAATLRTGFRRSRYPRADRSLDRRLCVATFRWVCPLRIPKHCPMVFIGRSHK